MGFRAGAYAKVWKIESISDTMTKINVSISRKSKKTGEYERDFSGFPVCVGSVAAKKALSLNEGDTIVLGDVDVCNSYNKEKNITYTNFKIFSFELADNDKKHDTGGGSDANNVDSGEQEPVEDDSRLPF